MSPEPVDGPVDAAVSSAAISVEERLFSLVLALLASEQGLDKAEILSTVQGYRQKFVLGGNNTSLDRQFERDKDDLRELGIPLDTIDAPDKPGDTQSTRYRIPRALYELPADITFSSEEITLLSLASAVWHEGSLSEDSRRALRKLRSLGIESSESVIGYAPRLRVRDAAFGPIKSALDRRVAVSFSYLKPGEKAPRQRIVEPRALLVHEGRWHLTGLDRGAQELRTFLLSRIVGEVKTVSGSQFDAPEADQAEQALAALDLLWANTTATIELVPGTDAELRLGKRAGVTRAEGNRYELHFTDLNVLADELCGFGPEVRVIEPQPLIVAVRDRLLQVVALHTDRGVTS